MILVIRKSADEKKLNALSEWVQSLGLSIHLSRGDEVTIMGLVGDTARVDADLLRALDIVEDVIRVSEPYKKANRKFHPDDSVFEVAGRKIGGGNFTFIAGPCSVESEAQIVGIAEKVKQSGADFLRGGAYKPRTSPYSFQGMGAPGIKLLLKAKAETGLPIVSELMSLKTLDEFADVDIIQIGARNMQNFELLKEVGRTNKPILLKRGLSATIEEWLMSAEYIMAEGNPRVILCERGIRTFEPSTRNTFDLSAIPVVKELTHLPVIADPSHALGLSRMVKPMSLAAAAAGSDGLMIEVHNNPDAAQCDRAQCITPDVFGEIVEKTDGILAVCGKNRRAVSDKTEAKK